MTATTESQALASPQRTGVCLLTVLKGQESASSQSSKTEVCLLTVLRLGIQEQHEQQVCGDGHSHSLEWRRTGEEDTDEASSYKDLSPTLGKIPSGLMASQRLVSKYGLPETPGLQSRHL